METTKLSDWNQISPSATPFSGYCQVMAISWTDTEMRGVFRRWIWCWKNPIRPYKNTPGRQHRPRYTEILGIGVVPAEQWRLHNLSRLFFFLPPKKKAGLILKAPKKWRGPITPGCGLQHDLELDWCSWRTMLSWAFLREWLQECSQGNIYPSIHPSIYSYTRFYHIIFYHVSCIHVLDIKYYMLCIYIRYIYIMLHITYCVYYIILYQII